jgi:mRNA-degrading endonuclease toxin of MazEF toxin-antitoxin module
VLDRPGASRLRLIVSSEPINQAEYPVVLSIPVTAEDRGHLLSVLIDGLGWVFALSIEATIRRRLGDVMGVASDDEMEAVSNALRAAQDL